MYKLIDFLYHKIMNFIYYLYIVKKSDLDLLICCCCCMYYIILVSLIITSEMVYKNNLKIIKYKHNNKDINVIIINIIIFLINVILCYYINIMTFIIYITILIIVLLLLFYPFKFVQNKFHYSFI